MHGIRVTAIRTPVGLAHVAFLLTLSVAQAQPMGLLGQQTQSGAPGRNFAVGPGNLQVTVAQLKAIAPDVSWDRAGQLVGPLSAAMLEYGITSPARRAAFLAQVAHESWGFMHMEEQSDGWAYEGRANLGNTRKGDGPRYKGRGLIQLTGRANYREAGQALGLDLEGSPWQAAQIDVAARTAAWFWSSKGLNALADRGDFHGITVAINGGTNGLADRWIYYGRARKAVGLA